uniref:Uncharacterized protein n=1 Tax=Hanusia phi TaxID=3032 RepID=A0A7S0F1V9_9CRYP
MIYELGKNKDGTDIDESNLLITKLIKMSENFLTEMAELANQGKHYEVIDLCERAMEEYKCFQEDLMDETVENNEAKLQILHSIAALNFSASTSAEAIKDHRKAIRCLNIVMESFPRVAELLPMFYMVRAVNYGMIGEREKSLKDLEDYEATMEKKEMKIDEITKILIIAQKTQLYLALDKHVETLKMLQLLRKMRFEDGAVEVVRPEEVEAEAETDKKYVDPQVKKSICDSTADFWTGVLHFKQGNYQGAVEAFESFDRHREAGTINELFLIQGWYEKYLRQLFGACHALGNYQSSAEYLSRLCDANPEELQYWQLYAENLVLCGRAQEAKAIYERMEQENQLADYNPVMSASYANCLVGLQEFPTAYEVLRQSLKKNPLDSSLHFYFLELRMQCLIHSASVEDKSTLPYRPEELFQQIQGEIPEARAGLKDGSDHTSLYKRSQLDVLEAQLLSWKNEREDKQLELLQRATTVCPSNFQAWMNLGMIQQAKGDEEGVADTLNKIQRILGDKAAEAAKQHVESIKGGKSA